MAPKFRTPVAARSPPPPPVLLRDMGIAACPLRRPLIPSAPPLRHRAQNPSSRRACGRRPPRHQPASLLHLPRTSVGCSDGLKLFLRKSPPELLPASTSLGCCCHVHYDLLHHDCPHLGRSQSFLRWWCPLGVLWWRCCPPELLLVMPASVSPSCCCRHPLWPAAPAFFDWDISPTAPRPHQKI